MMLSRLHRFLTASAKRFDDPRTLFWLTLSLAIALAYSLLALRDAFRATYVIQDDARQHVFWMQRFMDPDLFPGDRIADYFQTVAPDGYTAVYRIAAFIGLDPIFFHKILPVGLGLITAAYCFAVSLQLLPIPAAAFTATVLLGQGLGLTDAIVSATPKAFIYLLLLAFMDALLRKKMALVLVAIALQGLFYPQLVFISAGVLMVRLLDWRDGQLRVAAERGDRQFCLAGLAVAFLILLPYALQSHGFGPTITAAEARQLPEFSLANSRARFFDPDPAAYWLKGRSGLRLATALTPVTNGLGLLLPLLMACSGLFRLARQIHPGIVLLPQLLLSSLVMFGVAHLMLFKLHLPSRYTQHSVRVVLTLAAAIALFLIIEALLHWAVDRSSPVPSSLRSGIAVGIIGLLSGAVLAYPGLVTQFPITAYQTGNAPELYEFLRSQPKDTLIASLSDEANNLPSFAQRSVLVAGEYAIPYHLGYYQEFRQRVADLARAQYSPEPQVLRSFIERYGIDLWLLDRQAFKPDYVTQRLWIRQYPELIEDIEGTLKSGRSPTLATVVESCTVFKQKGLLALDASCVVQQTSSSKTPVQASSALAQVPSVR